MESGVQPGAQTVFGRCEIDAGKADRTEPEFRTPFTDARAQRPCIQACRPVNGRGSREIPMIEFIHGGDDSEARLRTHLASEDDTLALGARLAHILCPGLKVWLQGNLGSGKTTLTRGMLRALGHEGKVKSPTYTLIEPYTASGLKFYHFDFYRFHTPEEYLEAGLDEYFSGDGVCIVEWPEKALPFLALPDLEIFLELASEGRKAEIVGHTDAGQKCLIDLAKASRGADPAPVQA